MINLLLTGSCSAADFWYVYGHRCPHAGFWQIKIKGQRSRSIIHEKVPFLGQFWSQKLGMGSIVTNEGQAGYFWQRANYIWHFAKYCRTAGGFL